MAATTLTMAAAAAASAQLTSPIAHVSSFSRVQVRGAQGTRRRMMVCTAVPKGSSSGPAINAPGNKVAEKIEDAQEICAGDTQSEDCATAWSEVEAEKAKKTKSSDPLEEFCEDNPETDECRTYTD